MSEGKPTNYSVTLSADFTIAIPEDEAADRNWKPGQRFVLIPKAVGLLLVPAPNLSDLLGIARGANPLSYRDRTDRA